MPVASILARSLLQCEKEGLVQLMVAAAETARTVGVLAHAVGVRSLAFFSERFKKSRRHCGNEKA